MTESVDVTIIGGGVVGLAAASEIAQKGREVFLLEKNDTFGREQSSRSSEVIHAGIYYSPDYLKTQLCIEGNRLLYSMCKSVNIPCIKCGKIFIAADNDQAEALEGLFFNGIDNGLPLKMLSQQELHEREPNIQAAAAFLSPTSGIIDSHSLMRYYVLLSKKKEVHIAYRSEVRGIEPISGGYRLRVIDAEGEGYLETRMVINCAGFYSDRIAEMAGVDIDAAGYRLYLTKGEFYSVGGGRNRMINGLVYPPPEPLGPSIHVCFDVEKRLRLGPYFYYVDEANNRIDDSNRAAFEQSAIVKSLPFIRPEDLESESAGIMGVLYGQGEPVSDFIIKHEDDRGLPGFINLIGIDSPGLTASPAIARYVSKMVDEVLG